MNKTNHLKPVYVVIAIAMLAALLAYAWYSASNRNQASSGNAHGEQQASADVDANSPEKGPHSGKLWRDGNFALEVKIFETGVEPQLRLYAYQDNKPVAPGQFSADVIIKRLDAQEQIKFQPEADYLLGDQVIYEPHSFEMFITARHNGQSHQFKWTQLEGRLQLADASLKSSGLELLKVGSHAFQSQTEATGEVQIPVDQQVAVIAKSSGVVTSIHKTLGATVRAGEVIAVIDSRDLVSLRASQRTAQQQLSLAKSILDREQRLWKEKISPEQDYLQAKANYAEAAIRVDEASRMIGSYGGDAGGSDSKLYIRAPISGIVIENKAVNGQVVSSDTVLFQIADVSDLVAVVNVPEQAVSNIRPGMAAQIQAQGNDTLTAQGQISYISELLGAETRTAQVHIRFKNTANQWKQGQLLKASIGKGKADLSLAVRDDSLQTFRDWDVVFIRIGDQFEIRPVELGLKSDGFVQVLSGLKEGQVYAAGNSYLLKAELGKAGASHDH